MTKRTAQRIVIDVRAIGVLWTVRTGKGNLAHGATCRLKSEAVAIAVDIAHWIEATGGLAQVRVFGRNGQIQREMTYGADPQRSKG